MYLLRSLILSAVLLPTVWSSAETLLEFDFQNVEGTETKASQHTQESSNVGELINGAEIDTGPTGIEKGIPQILSGSLIIDRQMKGGSLGMKSTAGAGANNNACFGDYTRGAGFGTGTILMVFKPNFGKAGGGNTLFCTNVVSTQAGFFAIRMQGKKISLFMGAKEGATSAQIELPEWKPDQWYLIATSWRESASPTIYARALGESGGLFGAGDKPVLAAKNFRNGIRIGNGHSVKEPEPTAMMDGRMAYFLWTDEFAESQAAYDSLYEGITLAK